MALQRLRAEPDLDVVGLLTTVNTTHDRIAMHATRTSILEAQARAAGLPLHTIPLTCVLAGPMFRERVDASVGQTVERDGFWFADLVP